MSTIVTRKVKELPPHSREHVEEILGCALQEDQRIVVIVDAIYSTSKAVKKAPSRG